MIEKKIDELIAAIVALTAALQEEPTGGEAEDAPPPAEEEEQPKATPAKKTATKKAATKKAAKDDDAVTLEDLREVAKRLIKAGNSGSIREVVSEYGADSLSTLEEEHYAEVLGKLQELELA